MSTMHLALAGIVLAVGVAAALWAIPNHKNRLETIAAEAVKAAAGPPRFGVGSFSFHGDPRRVTMPDADPNDLPGSIDAVNRAMAEFMAVNDAALAELAAGQSDVVRAEQVDRISAAVTDLQSHVDENLARLSAASQIGGGPGVDPNAVAHAEAFDEWFRQGGDREAENALRDLQVKAQLTTQDDPKGGFTVPAEMDTEIDRVLGTMSAMRRISRVRPMGAKTFEKLVNLDGSDTGWVGEQQPRPETEGPNLSKLAFDAKTIYAKPLATEELLEDSAIDIAAWLTDEISETFSEQEGAAYVGGNLTTRPAGFLSYPMIANASWEWGKLGFVVSGNAAGFPSSNPQDPIIDLIYGLKSGYRANGRFIMNDLTTATVRKQKDGQGNYLWQPSAQAGQPATFHGYPVESDDNMPDIAANSFPIAFGDFMRGYLILDRRGTLVLRDPYSQKPYVEFYTTRRTAGGVQNFQAIKTFKISV